MIMSTAVVDIKPGMLEWISRQYEFNNLDMNLQKRLNNWLNGSQKPTFAQLQEICKKLHIPVGYLFLDTPPNEKLDILEYRTIKSEGIAEISNNLQDTVTEMEMIQDWMKQYLLENDHGPFPYGIKNMNKGEIVKSLYVDAGIPVRWFEKCSDVRDAFAYFREFFSALGITIMMNGVVGNNTHRKLSLDEFRAFTLFDDYAPLIFINGADSYNGKLFSLLHEVAHVWCGKDNLYNDVPGGSHHVSALEKVCNAVAAEILVPNNIFKQEWQRNYVENHVTRTIEDTAKFFRCGPMVITRRAYNNHFITYADYLKITKILCDSFKVSQHQDGGGNYYNTIKTRIDHRFFQCLANSVQRGTTPYTTAFRLTHTNRSTYDVLLHRIAGDRL